MSKLRRQFEEELKVKIEAEYSGLDYLTYDESAYTDWLESKVKEYEEDAWKYKDLCK